MPDSDRTERERLYREGCAADPGVRALAIRHCGLCDNDGYRGNRVCDHVDRTATHTRGIAEGPAYGTNMPSNHDRAGLWWGLFSALRAKRIPTAVCAPQTRAKWATGHGRSQKIDVLAAVRTWWPTHTIRNHDIADAASLATLGAFRLGDPMPFPIKPRHHNTLEAVSWPSNPYAKPDNGQVTA